MSAGGGAAPGSLRHRLAGLLPPRRGRHPRTHPVPAATAERAEPVDREVLDLLRVEAGRRLDQQHAEIAQLDTKAAALVAAGVALVSYVLATDRVGPVVVAALVAHAGVVVMGLCALAARSWRNAPDPGLLLQLLDRPVLQVHDVVLRAKVQAFVDNTPNLTAKADWVKLATWCLAVAMVLTCLARLV